MSSRASATAIAVAFMMLPGTVYAFTLFAQPLAVAFHWSSLELSFAFALALLSNGIAAAVGGPLTDRYGPSNIGIAGALLIGAGNMLAGALTASHGLLGLYIGYGIISGMGAGLAYISGFTTVVRWNRERPGLAAGLAAVGFGFGSLVIGSGISSTPQYQSVAAATARILAMKDLAHRYGRFLPAHGVALPDAQRSTLLGLFIAIGIISALTGTFLASALRFPNEEPEPDARYRDPSLASAMRTLQWSMIYLCYFVVTLAGGAIIGNAATTMHDLAHADFAEISGWTVALSAVGVTGRLIFPLLAERIGYRIVLATLLCLQALVALCIGSLHAMEFLIPVYAVAYFCFGGSVALLPAWTVRSFGTRHFGAIWGLCVTGFGVAGFFGPIFVTIAHANSNTYATGFLLVGTLLALAALFPIIMTETPRRLSTMIIGTLPAELPGEILTNG